MPRSPQLLTQQTYVVPVYRGGSVCRCKLHGGELSGDARYMGVMVGSCGTRWGRVEHGGVMLAVVFLFYCNNCLIVNCLCGAGLFLCGENGHLSVAWRRVS